MQQQERIHVHHVSDACAAASSEVVYELFAGERRGVMT
jgi:hypothetical protein